MYITYGFLATGCLFIPDRTFRSFIGCLFVGFDAPAIRWTYQTFFIIADKIFASGDDQRFSDQPLVFRVPVLNKALCIAFS